MSGTRMLLSRGWLYATKTTHAWTWRCSPGPSRTPCLTVSDYPPILTRPNADLDRLPQKKRLQIAHANAGKENSHFQERLLLANRPACIQCPTRVGSKSVRCQELLT